MPSNKFIYTKQTLKFCIAGFLIPGFTAILLVLIQQGFTLLGVECTISWTIVWTLTTAGMITAPIMFVKQMTKTFSTGHELSKDTLTIFNIVEYIFIQSTLGALFSNSRTLCYESDGQNGLQFVFTAWMALPLLVVLSIVFDCLRRKRLDEVRSA